MSSCKPAWTGSTFNEKMKTGLSVGRVRREKIKKITFKHYWNNVEPHSSQVTCTMTAAEARCADQPLEFTRVYCDPITQLIMTMKMRDVLLSIVESKDFSNLKGMWTC